MPSRPAEVVSEYKLLSDPLVRLKRYLYAETSTDDQQYNCERTQLFRVAKWFAIILNADGSILITTRSMILIY